MAKRSTKSRKKVFQAPRSTHCDFCVAKAEPDYKDYETLSRYLSDRARILGTDRSGVCAKHQRKLTREIKRARHLGLLPFTPSLR